MSTYVTLQKHYEHYLEFVILNRMGWALGWDLLPGFFVERRNKLMYDNEVQWIIEALMKGDEIILNRFG